MPTVHRPAKATVNINVRWRENRYAHPAQVLRFVSICYPDWNDLYRLAILVSAFSHPPAVLESNPRRTFFHLHDMWLSVTRAFGEYPDNTVGEYPNEAVQKAGSRTQACECA